MNVEEIKELIALMRKNRISEIDLEQKGTKVRIIAEPSSRTQTAPVVAMPPMQPAYYLPSSPAAMPADAAPQAKMSDMVPELEGDKPEPAEPVSSNLVEIKSPMVGTFYRAAAPDAPPYVEIGSVINKETVLCIIEAMKLMNEIKAETQGRIVKILVQNGQPVEYNQPLFLVEPQ